ncbi:hypothetical protein ILUMI_15344 [Ignelater luminosus]|uniref:Retrotransposon gag domain-containing protein n=1 Tax=Ignelater luminosus TaxID=2038154 RepID=A0A8K0CNS3_IGNLU|nr:hypothetical protein ILUMI_15344 [Ignelater luminosus]
MSNYSEINIAREMIPQYEEEAKICQEDCSHNKSIFEICCSKIVGSDRDTSIISNCSTWTKVRETLLNRFGDQQNEILLENDLATCYQLANENYDQYYERIKEKLHQLLKHAAIKQADETLRDYKVKLYKQRALDTYKAGLLELYRSFISYKSVGSFENCLVQFRNYTTITNNSKLAS